VATIRERKPGVWEVRVFTGRDESGEPTQLSRTVRGTKRDAQRLAASLESRPAPNAAGRTVTDALNAWREVNDPVWADSSRRDYEIRANAILGDPISKVSLARLSISDVEQWHARMRKARVGEAAIRSRHAAMRAALSQAVRWSWINSNAAREARLRQPRLRVREAMTVEEVTAVITAAATIDPAAALALRLAAVAGARRAELAGLRWADVKDGQLTISSSVVGDAEARRLNATKTGVHRTVQLDEATLAVVGTLRKEREQLSPYMFSYDDRPAPPARVGWWWSRSRQLSGIDRQWRLHDLRHWSATMAISAGHDVRTVAGRLGHANAALTLRTYAHVVHGADAQVATTLGDLIDAGLAK
jgi:integrase